METLITGLAAVVAATFTIHRLDQQIRQTEQLTTDQDDGGRAQHAQYFRSLFRNLADYATSCIKGLYELRPYFQADAVDRSRGEHSFSVWTLPHLPENVLLLKECTEFMDDDPAEAIVELIRHLQIQRSRIERYTLKFQIKDGDHLLLQSNIDQAMRDAPEIHARTSTLFPFSRGHPASSFSVTRNRICEAPFLAGCFYNDDEIDVLAGKWQEEVLVHEEIESSDKIRRVKLRIHQLQCMPGCVARPSKVSSYRTFQCRSPIETSPASPIGVTLFGLREACRGSVG